MSPQRNRLWAAQALVLAVACAAFLLPAGHARAVQPSPSRARVLITETTTDLREALSAQPARRFSPSGRRSRLPLVRVDDSVEYQKFMGAGAAMTDSAAWLIEDELPTAARDALMSRLFGPGGIDLNFLRIGVGSTDFDVGGTPYTYDDLPAGETDPYLADFSVAHDDAYMLPALRAARALNARLYLEAVPWSPPAWMKTSDSLSNLGHAGNLIGADEPVYAQYLVRFLQAYAAAGVPVSALGVQDEPTVDTVGPGLQLPQDEEATFVRDDLFPALTAAGLHQPLLGWDLSWGPLTGSDPLVQETETFRGAGGAGRPLLGGLAWHCYFGSPRDMNAVHAASPDSIQIVDECGTSENDPWSTGELIISALRNWANAVAYWNLALDPGGGPVVSPNIGCIGCAGLVTVDPATGTYTPNGDYYALGQLTRFVSPGARRIASNTLATERLDDNYQEIVQGLDDVALQNPNGSVVLLAHNNTTAPVTFQIAFHRGYLTDTVPAGATVTFRWR